MKKFLATTLVAMMAMASGFAQTAKHTAAQHEATATNSIVNKSAVQRAASNIKATPALVTGAIVNFVPLFTDIAGDLTSSVISQSGTNIGIGTATPAAELNVVGANPTLRVDNYSNVAGDSPNFNFQTARGTSAAPLATLLGDNLGQYAAKGYTGSGFPATTKVKVTFVATENWTPTANGTSMSFQTTANGTTARLERLLIDQSGNVGIGTTAPANPLSVNGIVQSIVGGFRFPDGSTQVLAAGLPTTDGSILVAGTLTTPVLAVNTSVIQARVSTTCAAGSAMTGVTQTGAPICSTIGAGGTLASVPLIVAQTSFTGVSGVGSPATIYTADADAFYRVSVYMNSPLPLGTCTGSCMGEEILLTWNDGVATASQATTNCSLAGPCSSSYVTSIWAASGTPITAYGQTTGAGATPSGSYTARFLVEKLQH